MRVRIVSDGTPRNTKILNAETGEKLDGVKSIKWTIDPSKHAVVEIEFAAIEIDALAELP